MLDVGYIICTWYHGWRFMMVDLGLMWVLYRLMIDNQCLSDGLLVDTVGYILVN